MATHRPLGGLAWGVGAVSLALGIRLGLLGCVVGSVGRQERMLAVLVLGLTWLLLGWWLDAEPADVAAGGFTVFPAIAQEDWLGDLAEAYGRWQQAGWTPWLLRVGVLLWFLQCVEARVRYACYKVVGAHRWKKL